MDLKDFVREALAQVAAGVEEAQSEVRDSGGFVNPAHRVNAYKSDDSHFGALENGQNIFLVDFDVSVTVAEESGGSANAKLQVASLMSIGGGGEARTSNTATNRISFKVPLGLPVDSVSEEHLKEQDEVRREKNRKRTESMRNRNRGIDSWQEI